jgi:putative ABC transport system permease protein
MTWLWTLTSRFFALFRKRQLDEELEEELQFHLEKEVEENIRRGMTPEAARDAARRSFGGVEQAKEAYRDTRGLPGVDSLWQDVRFGVRMLAKSPGLTAVAVLSLALGIGANTTMFSVINSIVFRPPPYKDPDRIVMVSESRLDRPEEGWMVSAPTFRDWKEHARVFEQLSALRWWWTATLTGGDQPERVSGRRVSEGFFNALGARTYKGRLFVPEDHLDGAEPVAILSHGLWRRRFGSDPGIVGKRVQLDGTSYTVVGVMSSGFHPWLNHEIELWVPFTPVGQDRDFRPYSVIGRLKPGVDTEQAQAEMDIIASRIAQEHPDSNRGWGARVESLHEWYVYDIREGLFLLLGAVCFVLLIACANVANLLLARAAAREKEIAVRSSLGAGRGRLIRQFLTESLLLALVGGAVSLLLAYWGVELFAAISPDLPFGGLQRRIEITSLDAINSSVFMFTVSITLVTGLLFGLAPAVGASKPDLNESLKETGGRASAGSSRQQARSVLVVAQVALTLVLLAGAGLMMNSFAQLWNIPLGFDPDNLLTFRTALPRATYVVPGGSRADGTRLRRLTPEAAVFQDQVLRRFEALPGVESASLTTLLPFEGCIGGNFTVESRPPPEPGQKAPWASHHPVTPGYYRTMQVPLLRGRGFTERDTQNSPWVAVISETMVRQYFPNQDPLGQHLTMTLSGQTRERPREIVGVVVDVRQSLLRPQTIWPEVYVPYAQQNTGFPGRQLWQRTTLAFVIRSTRDPESLVPTIRRVVADSDKDLPLFDVGTSHGLRLERLSRSRFYMLLLVVFASVAVAIAAVGVYGALSYSVAQRTHEIGIRMALGADRGAVLKSIVKEGLMLTLIGVAIGLAAAFGLTRFLESQLYAVEPTDPVTFAAVTLLLVGVALLSCYIPARRATKVDLMVALRHE